MKTQAVFSSLLCFVYAMMAMYITFNGMEQLKRLSKRLSFIITQNRREGEGSKRVWMGEIPLFCYSESFIIFAYFSSELAM